MVPQALARPSRNSAPVHFAHRVGAEYEVRGSTIRRRAFAGSFASSATMSLRTHFNPESLVTGGQVAALWNELLLEGKRPAVLRPPDRPSLSVVDLFCGCGGLSLGIKCAAEAVGVRPIFELAADVAPAALRVYAKNLRPLRSVRQNVETLVDYDVVFDRGRSLPNLETAHLGGALGQISPSIDLLIAGPPCEGNSNFNNRTRRVDPRNDLYLHAVVAGIALGAKAIVLENVPMVTRSRQGVVRQSLRLLRDAGYRCRNAELSLLASDYGTPQTRLRHFLVVGRDRHGQPADLDALRVAAPTAGEALSPLLGIESDTTFDRPSCLSSENRRRVRILAETGTYDLPDSERPDCHRLKDHTYPAVYGRMRPDDPAPTLTTGFLSPGRGRFTHPLRPRSLTPHEGARLQGFGESFNWLKGDPTITRADYANMIGSAVPPPLGFVVGMWALSLL